MAFGSDDRYLQFREFYGLTLPILFNTWPYTSEDWVQKNLQRLLTRQESPEAQTQMSVKDYDRLRIDFGDRSRFIMPILLQTLQNPQEEIALRRMASRFFVRGGTQQAYVGPSLSEKEKQFNKKIGKDNQLLESLIFLPSDDASIIQEKVKGLSNWYEENQGIYNFTPSFGKKIGMFFFETRFFRYMSRVLTLDFGTLRNDANKTVIYEVVKRFKYSLTLAIIPMFLTFFLCQVVGFTMAITHNRLPDISLNMVALILYAIPVFVVAPFLIEKVALNHSFPFTDIPIPISGFTSPDKVYEQMTSGQRFFDIVQHVALPMVAIIYGSLAAESRLSRTAILEVSRQDYVRTARAKGVPPLMLWVKHIGRNAAITIVTSLAGSLGIILGGSLIVETLFQINGFGKFFYDAVINRDYNVIMFSTLAGSFLSLLGYLAADIAYTLLDPRVTLD